jgi:hypothetical protein
MTNAVTLAAFAAGPAFSAYFANGGSNLSVTSGTQTKIPYDTEEYDTSNCFDVTTNKGRFTPTVAGYYQINATFSAEPSTTITRCLIEIWKNGANYKRGVDVPLSLYQPVIGSLVYCNGTTDYIEIYAYIEGTAPRVRGVASTIFTWVNGYLARSA